MELLEGASEWPVPEAFFDSLRQRENELLKQRNPK
jgi:hypothetical protein